MWDRVPVQQDPVDDGALRIGRPEDKMSQRANSASHESARNRRHWREVR